MKNFTGLLALILLMGVCAMSSQAQITAQAEQAKAAATPERQLGWRLAVQAWSFNHLSFYEAIDKTAALGIHFIEAYPGQKLSPEHPEVAFDQNLPAEYYDQVLAKLKQARVKLVNYGVVEMTSDEAKNRKLFEFAKRMGLETIVSEPAPAILPQVDRLCQEFKINVAIHNHPKPSFYWNPETLAKAIQGCSPRIGSCADVGHWVRSGVDPLAALKLLKGRIISLHFKDINKHAADGADVPWGTGVINDDALLAELHRQGFRGVFSAEHEIVNREKTQPEIAQSARYFHEAAAKLAAKKTE